MSPSMMSAGAAVSAAVLLSACAWMGGGGNSSPMTYFVTSANPGKGGDLGGLAGADQYCKALATSVGAGNHVWRAYLSAAPSAGSPAVNARDRIGRGPWRNVKGEVVATSVDDLHSANNKLSKQTSLTEKGSMVSGSGDPVNMHDILTGSTADGRLDTSAPDTTCRNWTSGTTGAATVGHVDRKGLRDDAPSVSWNASHPTRGCDMESLKATGGAGLMYCFAAD